MFKGGTTDGKEPFGNCCRSLQPILAGEESIGREPDG